METLKAKRKEFEIIEKLGEKSYHVRYKKKEYFYKKLDLEDDSFFAWLNNYKTLKVAGILMPKMFIIDKKEGVFVEEFIPGETVFDALLKDDLTDDYLKPVFINEFYEKQDNIALDYHPENWKLFNGKMYYLIHEFTRPYEHEKSFSKHGIFFWFYTKTFTDYASSKGHPIDSNRVKSEYETNREILKTVVQFHL